MTDLPPVTHVDDGKRGAFVIERDGERLAAMTYTLADRTAIIDHTEVSPRLRGTGAGARLVLAAVEWARQDQRRILPLCPFARSVFDKTPDYSDVLV